MMIRGAERAARTCYDHLAGRLGVAVTAALVDAGALVAGGAGAAAAPAPAAPASGRLPADLYVLGPAAGRVFGGLGVPAERLVAAPRAGRPLLRFCVDGTERRPHLAGRLGAELLAAFRAQGWLMPGPGGRAVRLTPAGAGALGGHLGLSARGLSA